MGFTRRQIMYVQGVRRRVLQLREDDDLWRVLLRNAGCKIDPKRDVPSLSHKGNTQENFELLMFYLAGYPSSGLDSDHWGNKIDAARRRLVHSIESFADACLQANIMQSPEALASFVERMTASAGDDEEDEQTRTSRLEDCTLTTLIKIAEGIKAWMRREAASKGMPCPKFGGGGSASSHRQTKPSRTRRKSA